MRCVSISCILLCRRPAVDNHRSPTTSTRAARVTAEPDRGAAKARRCSACRRPSRRPGRRPPHTPTSTRPTRGCRRVCIDHLDEVAPIRTCRWSRVGSSPWSASDSAEWIALPAGRQQVGSRERPGAGGAVAVHGDVGASGSLCSISYRHSEHGSGAMCSRQSCPHCGQSPYQRGRRRHLTFAVLRFDDLSG